MRLSVANAILSAAVAACAITGEPRRGQRCKCRLQGWHTKTEISQSARLFLGANAAIMFQLKALSVAKIFNELLPITAEEEALTSIVDKQLLKRLGSSVG